MDYFIPDTLREDFEATRRAQLVAGLSILGLVFGSGYATFYSVIGHIGGMSIIIACIIALVGSIFLMRVTGKVGLAGNLSILIWYVGFSALTAIEGGVHGHSIAWLSCGVPLLALLILNRFMAVIWCGACFLMTLFFCTLELAHVHLPLAYPEQWHPEVTAAGFVGLAVFMALVGLLFEESRKHALLMMQAAVSERMRTEEAKQAAEGANRAKDQFLAMLSHELRTPLTPVLAAVTGIGAQDDLPPEVRADLEMINRNVKLEAKLIDDLLDVTRISSGKIVLNLAVVDAHSCLQSALEICRTDIDAKNLQISLALEAIERNVRADPVRLRQVFWNLIRNAIKFTPEKGHLTIRSSNLASRLRIDISDTGVGIEPELLPIIFDAFEQGGQTKTRRFGGLGLGLSIAKGVVEMHHGTLTAFSAGMDRGATFTVELPTILPKSEPLEPLVRTPVSTQAEVARILLVEDDADTRRILARLLRRNGYEVTTADCVQKGLELSDFQKFDIVISDLGLPDGSGLDMMRRLKEHYGYRGIALSGFGTEDDIRKSLAAGFGQHIVKPVDFDVLRTAIQQVI